MNVPHIPPRWSKLLRDVALEKERVALMFAALVASLIAIATVLGAWQILRREIRANYLATQPAMATLEVEGGIDDDLLAKVRDRPEILQAEARDVLQCRVQVGEEWLPLLVFASESLTDLRLNRFFPERGAWPAAEGTLLLERNALPILGADIGTRLRVRLPEAGVKEIAVTGVVHDPGLPPAYQERQGYAYASTESLRGWGEDPRLHELRIAFRGTDLNTVEVRRLAETLATDLVMDGVRIEEIRVPPFERHPHQTQMETILVALLLFTALALVLSSVLVATTLSGWLARQTRELAVMKAVGATSLQISGIYLAFVAALGAVACLVAWPLGGRGAILFAERISSLLNFGVNDASLGLAHPAVLVLAGIAVPLLVAWVPIRAASRASVREAMADWGAAVSKAGSWGERMPGIVRRLVRRPRRLALSLLLLGSSGAIFMTALNVREGWTENLAKIWRTRHYDIEIRFRVPQSVSELEALEGIPGIVQVEPWSWNPASLARPGRIEMVQVWPDKGHGSFSLMGIPTDTRLVSFPVIRGRWLRETDSTGTMLNHFAWAQAGKPEIGTSIHVGLDGRILAVTVVGVIEEVGSPALAYLTSGAFAELAGTEGRSRMVRVVTSAETPSERAEILRDLERVMEERAMPVQLALPFSELKTAIGDHMKVLLGALFGLAGIIGLVGVLGLASVTGMGVLERTREFGVLKTLGATPGTILGMVLGEAVLTGALSWILGFALAWPLTWAMDAMIGSLGFLAPLPFVFAPDGPLVWLALVVVVSLVAGWIPASRAGRITVREALVEV